MLILNPHARDLGGFTVQRLLPAFPTKMIGPFIFFDHFGPIAFAPGEGADVRPHPHIGLATVTYLFEGEMIHRDSLGSVQTIEPGAVNWMTAGRGIVHSERTPPETRVRAHRMHGVQTWVALPKDREMAEPSFSHQPKAILPEIVRPGVTMRLLAGTAFGRRAPTPIFSPMFYVAVEMEPGATIELPPEHEQRGVYAVDREVLVAGEALPAQHCAVLAEDATVRLEATTGARVMLFGGAGMDGDRKIWWNFVASSRALIDAASERWREQSFPPIPGETEFIPLPERH
ncbi:MAG: pirin family protein [Betaproteobacteria bacterium]|nr:MAG: pirin family protein [Betaproteobacteria bacterium]